MILTAIALMLASQETRTPTISIPADGQKHKIVYKGDTFKITWTGNQIIVDRMEKLLRNNITPAIRLLMKEVAREATGCDLKDEYYAFYNFQLEATLVCPNDKGAGA